jgi:hypothetical protein
MENLLFISITYSAFFWHCCTAVAGLWVWRSQNVAALIFIAAIAADMPEPGLVGKRRSVG